MKKAPGELVTWICDLPQEVNIILILHVPVFCQTITACSLPVTTDTDCSTGMNKPPNESGDKFFISNLVVDQCTAALDCTLNETDALTMFSTGKYKRKSHHRKKRNFHHLVKLWKL